MTGRGAAVVLMVLGAAIAVLPAFAWYSAPVGDQEVRASGFEGAGQLLVLPALGALAALAGVGLAVARPGADRAPPAARAGLVAAVAGALALAFAIWAAAAPRLTLSADLPGGAEDVPARIDLEPAALVAPVLAAAMLLLGAAMAWTARRR